MITYHSLLKAFKVAGISDFDLEDVECIAVSLIHKVYIFDVYNLIYILYILFNFILFK